MRRTLSLFFALAASSACLANPRFDGERAMELLEQQVAFGPRVPGSEAASRTLGWMMERLRAQADEVVPHSFRTVDPRDSTATLRLTNVRAVFRPEATQRFALAAHWDCRPVADQDSIPANRSRPVDGANDSASGVAVLLHLAELMAEQPPAVGIDLLFFDGEDLGLEGDPESYALGSQRFVRDFPRYRPQAVILLDMVGDADLRIPMEKASLQYAPELTWRVFNAAARLGLSAFEPIEGEAVFDDHIAFLRAGIPAVDLIDMEYSHWHTTEDLPDKCSPQSLEQVGRLMVHLVYTDFANWGF